MNSINSLQLSKDKNPEKVISEEGSQEEQEVIVPLIKKSYGVRKSEILYSQYQTVPLRILFFASVFLVCYCYSIDGITRNNLMLYATSSYRNHSGFTTINVLTAVIGVFRNQFMLV